MIHFPDGSRLLLFFRGLFLLFVAGTAFFFYTYEQDYRDELIRKGKLTAAIRMGPTIMYYDSDGHRKGYDYELIEKLARHLGLELELVEARSLKELFTLLDRNLVDVAIGAVTITPRREAEGYLFSHGYFNVLQLLVCRKGSARPASLDDLNTTRIKVIESSAYVQRLEELARRFPGITWEETDEMDTDQIFEEIDATRRSDLCTVSDNNIYYYSRRYYPYLDDVFPLNETQSLGLVTRRENDKIKLAMDRFLKEQEAKGEMETLYNHYYSYESLSSFDFIDTILFRKNIDKRLPQYEELFRNASEDTGIPWTLLAAIAYQESHLRSRARSYTGVRGLMMLTLPTARDYGIKSRLDPAQSVRGGSRYFRDLLGRIPPEVHGWRNRLSFALASYNVGFYHVMDAMELAEFLGKNPARWDDVKEVLPMLSRKKYYQLAKYGYCRGREAVRYTERVWDYYNMLEQMYGLDRANLAAG